MSAPDTELSGAKRRILERLKRAESATAPELAVEFGLTDTAVRQHLDALEQAELVERCPGPAGGRGRPPVHWRVAEGAGHLFADRHAALSVELLRSVRDELGDDALHRVVDGRAERQTVAYRRAVVGPDRPLVERVRSLAEVRSLEGFLAEAVPVDDGVLLLEHHCPIRDAAEHCGHLCAAELDVFRRTLGPQVHIEREQHVLEGDQRCAYRVTPA